MNDEMSWRSKLGRLHKYRRPILYVSGAAALVCLILTPLLLFSKITDNEAKVIGTREARKLENLTEITTNELQKVPEVPEDISVVASEEKLEIVTTQSSVMKNEHEAPEVSHDDDIGNLPSGVKELSEGTSTVTTPTNVTEGLLPDTKNTKASAKLSTESLQNTTVAVTSTVSVEQSKMTHQHHHHSHHHKGSGCKMCQHMKDKEGTSSTTEPIPEPEADIPKVLLRYKRSARKERWYRTMLGAGAMKMMVH